MRIRVGERVLDKPLTFTVAELVEAVRKNGVAQGKMHWWKKNNGFSLPSSLDFGADEAIHEVESACAMGQAAINLGVDYGSLDYAAAQVIFKDNRTLAGVIMRLNDVDGYSLEQIADYVKQSYGGSLDKTFTVSVYNPVEILSED